MHSRIREVISDTAVFLKRSRYTLLMRPNFKEYIGGRIIDISKSGGFFVEPDGIYEKNNQLEELILKEEAERRKILTSITNLVRKNSQKLMYNEKRIGYFDLQVAKFQYARDFEQPTIEFSNKPVLSAKNIKHPILSHINKNTKSVNIDLKTDSKLIITGPNTGGKTVFLKTAGLCILSVFSNIPPIASHIEIGSFDAVFAIIGDEQNILESLSSFSAKMLAVKEIYNKITKNSLVLLDEIGSGTSPDEGEAVAYSIISNLTDKCSFIVTTHYKKLAYILASKQYRTAAFEFDEKTLKPTYRLIYNKVGQSYATEILQTLNMPQAIIDTANEFYKNNETRFSKLETELENEIKRVAKKEKEFEDLKNRYEELIAKQEKVKEEFISRTKQEEQLKKKQYEELIDELKSQLSSLLKDKNISYAHKKLNKIKKDAQNIFSKEKTNTLNQNLQINDIVSFNSMKGTIVNIKGKKATVEINGKAIEAPLSSLTRIEKDKKDKKKIAIQTNNKFESIELNIIGKRRDEAELELMRFLDSLIMDSVKTARIVHGIGSGILRSMVHDTLKNHPYVKSFHSAHPNEGGDGATIVEFK
jgi:DNA mismatch repair protein MutS2